MTKVNTFFKLNLRAFSSSAPTTSQNLQEEIPISDDDKEVAEISAKKPKPTIQVALRAKSNFS